MKHQLWNLKELTNLNNDFYNVQPEIESIREQLTIKARVRLNFKERIDVASGKVIRLLVLENFIEKEWNKRNNYITFFLLNNKLKEWLLLKSIMICQNDRTNENMIMGK